jgi:hypothetical protein
MMKIKVSLGRLLGRKSRAFVSWGRATMLAGKFLIREKNPLNKRGNQQTGMMHNAQGVGFPDGKNLLVIRKS